MTFSHATKPILVSAAFAAAALGASQAHAWESSSPCAVEQIEFTLASYHKGTRDYGVAVPNPALQTYDPSSGAAAPAPYIAGKRHLNERNPGVIVGAYCPNLPSFLQHPQIGYLRNSFYRPATYFGFENKLLETRNADVTLVTAIMPTGYSKPMPVIGLAVEGKGPFMFQGDGFQLRPFMLVSPIGLMTGADDKSKAIYIFGIKAVFGQNSQFNFGAHAGGKLTLNYRPQPAAYNGEDGPFMR